ncbi:hypothetical protein [Prevotella sp. P2-180]|uniref:hypothetical protein n=1 Tax=Prevotella sp. P2-180 TaxID=2024224 RepID=UPI0011407AF3|nr:hypothetical protein [Prevotella sp. P2-180]
MSFKWLWQSLALSGIDEEKRRGQGQVSVPLLRLYFCLFLRDNDLSRPLFLDEIGNLSYPLQAVLTFESQVKEKLASEDFSVRETSALLNDKKVRIIAFSDIRNELSSRELESWTKLIRVLTHEIMNNVAPITSLSETLGNKADDADIKEGLSVINSTGRQLLNFVDNYRRMTLIPKPQPKLFYVKPFLERMKSDTTSTLFRLKF